MECIWIVVLLLAREAIGLHSTVCLTVRLVGSIFRYDEQLWVELVSRVIVPCPKLLSWNFIRIGLDIRQHVGIHLSYEEIQTKFDFSSWLKYLSSKILFYFLYCISISWPLSLLGRNTPSRAHKTTFHVRFLLILRELSIKLHVSMIDENKV